MTEANRLTTFVEAVREHAIRHTGTMAIGSALADAAVLRTVEEALDPMVNREMTTDEKVILGSSWFTEDFGVPISAEVVRAAANDAVNDPAIVELWQQQQLY
jgi:methanogenic corrinoid protein MtbC1